MGCYNKTCSLSNLPIFRNDPTVLFFIVENTYEGYYENQPSNSTAYWCPIPIPFFGKYDDYGAQELDDGEEQKLFLLHDFLSNCVKPFEGDEYHTAVDKDIFTKDFSEIVKAIYDGNLKINFYSKTSKNVSFVMFHRDIYDTLMKEIIPSNYEEIITNYKLFESEKNKDFYKLKYETICKNSNSKITFEEFMKLAKSSLPCRQSYPYEYAQEKKYSWDSSERDLLSMFEYSSTYAPFIFESQFSYNKIPDVCQFRHIVEGALINLLYCKLRKIWIPAAGNGSQEGLNDLHLTLLTSSINNYNIRKDKEKQWDCEYD